MRKEKTLLIIGVWVSLLSFLGFPIFWRKILFLITGLAIMYLAYLFYLEVKSRLLKDTSHNNIFIDNVKSGE